MEGIAKPGEVIIRESKYINQEEVKEDGRNKDKQNSRRNSEKM